VAFACTLSTARAQESSKPAPVAAASLARVSGRVTYNTVNLDGLDIFYREAASRENPTVLLLHGFPTSSQMFQHWVNEQFLLQAKCE